MKTTICLVRHGETEWNRAGKVQGREDTALNRAGREQALCAGIYLQQWPWDRIVTSPLRRARDTARIIAEQLGMDVDQEMVDLIERDYGESSGLTLDEIEARFPNRSAAGIEPRAALQARVMRGLETIVRETPGQRVLAVAHGGVINAILAELSGGIIGSGKTVLHNACLSTIHYAFTPNAHSRNEHSRNEDGIWEIENYNRTDHLSDVASLPAARY